MYKTIVAIIFLFLFWFLLSGEGGYLAFIGLLLSSLVYVFAQTYLYKKTDISLLFSYKMVRYLPWLIYQIACSTIYILKLIYSQDLYVKINSDNDLLVFDLPFKSDTLNVLLGCSVILTPGTTTLYIDNDNNKCFFHALTKDLESGVQDISNYIGGRFIGR